MTLINQTEYELSQIFNKPIKLELSQFYDVLTLKINGKIPSKIMMRILQVVVAGLVAKPDSYLILNMPDNGLSEYSINRLIEFLVGISKKEIQLFIESYSDQVLTSLCTAITRKTINSKDLQVLVFKDYVVEYGEINSIGNFVNNPLGLFDQQTQNIDYWLKG